jgi:cytochrome c
MNTMLLTKISGAVLLTALVAMIVSFAGDILVPVGGRKAGHGEGHVASAGHGEGGGEAGEAAKEPPVALLLAKGNLEEGKRLAKRCLACHTLEKGGPNRIGPNLYGVLGRERGSHPGFGYSQGMKAAGGKWTFEGIYHFLHNPGAAVKGTKMTFKLPNPQERADVLLYLRTLSDNPLPLPPPPKEEAKKPEAKAPAGKPEEKKAETQKPEAKKPEAKQPAEKPAEKAPAQTAALGALLAAADVKHGETLVKRKCGACHSYRKGASHKVGPNLYGVVLRDRGTIAGYHFSSAMKAKGGKWSYADLFTFLKDPKAFVKGTKMTLSTASEKDRADVIAYLRTLADSPPPLPAK